MYPQVFGKYVLERELSRGGMARVVLATLRGAGGFEKRLVVKQIRDELSFDQQFIRRFVEEANITVALSHPNIVPVYELGVEQGTYFLAMELVEGCSIAELVRQRNPDGSKRLLTPEEGAYIGMEVCRALDYAHRRMKVVHRDITPRNVMLDEEGQVKLIDFGIAAPALVAGQEILGSPGHMPPEQVEGKELGPPTDIFAVAVLLMEAWTGLAPFRRGTPEECDVAMRQPHPRPSDLNARLIPLDDVIVRAMQLDPKKRQQDASDLGRALRAFLQGTDVTDIARELGDRVRDLRQIEAEPPPMSLVGGAMRPLNASVTELGTKTFAAREEAIRWSTPPAAEIEEPGASTRRLEPSALGDESPRPMRASEGRVALGGRRPAPSRSADPAMSIPTPLMVEPVGTGSELLRTARAAQAAARVASQAEHARPRRRDNDPPADTLATRGLAIRQGNGAGSPALRSRTFALVVGAAVVLVGTGLAWRSRTTSARSDVVTTATVAPTPAPTPSASAPAAPLAPSAEPSSSPPTGAVVFGQPSAHATTPASSPAIEKPGKALVSFYGDPGTRVSIDGASRGATPVKVSLEPGQHDVRFQFDPTGESRGERFSVRPGERVQVRADFTGATPTVRILR